MINNEENDLLEKSNESGRRKEMTFSLLDEPWIPCVLEDGSRPLLGLRDLFSGKCTVTEIRADSPAQTYALYRLVLAIFWRAHAPGEEDEGDPLDWVEEQFELVSSQESDTVVLDYLDRFHERFDLLHESTPFMQVAGLTTKTGRFSPIHRIVPEADSHFFTMRAGASRESIDLAEAARWVVYVQAFDFSGIKSGAEGDPRVKGGKGYPIGTGWTGMTGGTLVVGDCLRETLILNTVWGASEERDKPVWERSPDTAAQRENPTADFVFPEGPADLATWQSRRIKLHLDPNNPERVVGVLVSNGDRIPNAGANIFGDPMTAYRYSSAKSKKDKPVYYPRPFGSERTMWRGLPPLISMANDAGFGPKNLPPKRPETLSNLATLRAQDPDLIPPVLKVELFSVEYGAQASSVGTEIHFGLELPVAVLKQESVGLRRIVLDAAQASNDAAIALGSFSGQLKVAAGGEYEFQAYPTDGLLAVLEPQFVAWLSGVTEQNAEARAVEWQHHLKQSVLQQAEVLVRGAGPKALVGRPVDSGDKTRIQSAGTALMWLRKKLKEVLPLTELQREEDENERNSR